VFKDEQYEKTGVSFMDIMVEAIRTKYCLIRYYYSQYFALSMYGGAPLYRPLFIDYHNDRNAFNDLKYNIMIGDSLKVSVLSDKTGQDHTDFYFPKGTWCNVFNATDRCFDSKGEHKTLRTTARDAYVHLRQGKIVPLQDAFTINFKKGTLTTRDLQDEPVEFHILGKADPDYDAAWYAESKYYNDDGETLEHDGTYNKY